jgi:tRNA 2-selenouridine synthase
MIDNDSLFRGIFLNNIPLLDTRSPGEFAKGSFPTALNLPLMLDDERAKVGTCYKHQGQEAAIALGHKLVSGATKQQRVDSWREFTQTHPQGYLFCWRGGLRSQIVQSWLQEAGVEYPRIPGGYKALRRFLMDQTENIVSNRPLVLLAGRTGSGKTQLLNTLANSIDLEGLANHRGSSFGQRPDGQPGQILFENKLAIELMKKVIDSPAALVLEDESGFIGSCSLPLNLFQRMKLSPRVLVDVPLEDRIETILQDYIVDLYSEYINILGEQGRLRFADTLRSGLQRLSKRLGNEACHNISIMLEQALKAQFEQAEVDAHRLWIRELLVNYYDPSYDYQLSRHQQSVLFKGDKEEVRQWFAHQNALEQEKTQN